MRKRTIVFLVIFILSLGCIVGFKYAEIPQGCFTLFLIVSGVGLCIDFLTEKGK